MREHFDLRIILLTIEMTEQQISGRNISLNIDYEDVLSADSFNTALLEEE